MSREAVRDFINKQVGGSMLEIGPLANPFLSKDVYDVYYADIKNKDEIFAVYRNCKELGPADELYGKITPIDFVVKDGYLNAVGDKRFSVVFSSHVLEHVPDVIGHLLELSEILEEGGHVAMIIPDKRYTFDHFREVTPFRDMMDVYLSKDIRSTARLVFDNCFNINSCNDPVKYHNSSVSFEETAASAGKYTAALNAYKRVCDTGSIMGVHYWVFTYTSFLDFLRDGLRAGLLPFTLRHSYPTIRGSMEFSVILQKDSSILIDDTKRKEEIMKLIKLSKKGYKYCYVKELLGKVRRKALTWITRRRS